MQKYYNPKSGLQMLRGLQMEIPFWAKMEATQNLRSIWISPTFPIICSNYVLHQNQQLLYKPNKKNSQNPKKKETATTEPLKKKMTGKKNTDFKLSFEKKRHLLSLFLSSFRYASRIGEATDQPGVRGIDFFLWIRMVIHSWYNKGIYGCFQK